MCRIPLKSLVNCEQIDNVIQLSIKGTFATSVRSAILPAFQRYRACLQYILHSLPLSLPPSLPPSLPLSICQSLPPSPLQTYIGSVVVSVNPYKQIGIYDSDAMEEYRGVNFYEMPPHMYAYVCMCIYMLVIYYVHSTYAFVGTNINTLTDKRTRCVQLKSMFSVCIGTKFGLTTL